jgi:hypothetical protein
MHLADIGLLKPEEIQLLGVCETADNSQLEAGCFRYYLDRILALDGSVPDQLKREIAAVLMICETGVDIQKLLEERDRQIQMLEIICRFAFKLIATLEDRSLIEESVSRPDGREDAVV